MRNSPVVTNKALLIVDVQNDFCEGGSLPVVGGSSVATEISELLIRKCGDVSAVSPRGCPGGAQRSRGIT